jgi:hypothetical protein
MGPLEGFERLREQHGDNNPAGAGQGLKYGYEGLPRLRSGLSVPAGNGFGKQVAQPIELPVHLLEQA